MINYDEYSISSYKSFFIFLENISLKKQALLLEEVQKLNKQNAETLGLLLTNDYLDLEAGESTKKQQQTCNSLDHLLEDSRGTVAEKQEVVEVSVEELEQTEPKVEAAVAEKEPNYDVKDVVRETKEEKIKISVEKKETDANATVEAAGVPAADDKEPTSIR